MTRLLIRTLAVATAASVFATAAARAADVALFFDPAFVDTQSLSPNAEAVNVLRTLEAQGHRVGTFTGITAPDIRAGLAGRDVLVIPDLEVGDLQGMMSANAKAEIHTFIFNGGTLVVFGTPVVGGGPPPRGEIRLLNDIIPLLLLGPGGTTAGTYFLDIAAAAGTQFEGGAASVPANTTTETLAVSSLPVGARAVYASGSDVAVAVIPEGRGFVVYVGWDWDDAVPEGFQASGWLEVLNAAVNQRIDPAKPNAALLKDGAIVDFRYDIAQAEASNLLASAQHMGHKVLPFDPISAPDLQTVLGSRDVLIIPEQEIGELIAVLSPAAQDTIADFVAGGGMLLVFGTPGTPRRDLTLLNGLFGFSLAPKGTPSSFALDVAATAGTPFAGGPLSLPSMRPPVITTVTIDDASLPPGARAVYRSPAGDVAVAAIRMGCGNIVYMGWDWMFARPIGGVLDDAGWLEVLNRALSQRRRAYVANDFDGDGYADILWRRSTGTTHPVSVWLMRDGKKVDGRVVGSLDPLMWDMAGTGDFNGDCKADVLWRNLGNGTTSIWMMDGFKKTSQQVGKPPLEFQVRSVKDYNRDGKSDVLWRQTVKGNAVIWLMDGFSKTGQPAGTLVTDWVIEE